MQDQGLKVDQRKCEVVCVDESTCMIGCHSGRRRRRRLKGIHSRSDTNRTGAEGLSFYYPRLLHCLDQMLTMMSLNIEFRHPKPSDLVLHVVPDV